VLIRAIMGTVAAIIVALLAIPAATEAQPRAKVPRVGVLTWETCPTQDSTFGVALRGRGYVWGQTIQIVCRSAEGDYSRLAEAAGALATQKVDVIAALTHITAYAARQRTQSIPIVMITSGDPVATGLVASLARPGGNITGLTYYASELVEKRMQLLKEMVLGIARIAALANPESAHVFGLYRTDAESAARALRLQLLITDVSQPRDLDQRFESMVKAGAQGLLVLTDPMLSSRARRIAELAAQHRLPAMYWAPWFVNAGGLAAYSADYDDLTRRAVYYVDRILTGTKPADLPVEQPTKFELVINLKTARALGLTIPPSVLLRADRVIE
jgi:putative ABC transport system substrate-binding protein